MKLVREYINEKFSDESDPIHDMGIGGDNVNLFKIASNILKKYPKYKNNDYANQTFHDALGKWVDYMKSLQDKTLYGKFKSEETSKLIEKKIKIARMTSYHFGYSDFSIKIQDIYRNKFYIEKNQYYVILHEQI